MAVNVVFLVYASLQVAAPILAVDRLIDPMDAHVWMSETASPAAVILTQDQVLKMEVVLTSLSALRNVHKQ